jgi:phosphomannomutase/phosphoglucomutase
VQIERKIKVVVDCGSGVAGAIAPDLLAAIGADVEPLYCDVDGTFPHHHPDPSDPANLVDLINVVQRVGAELGLALDGDGDRLGVVTRTGEIIYPDRLLMLFASDVLERNPGACVIYDVKCTGHLATHILRHGGSPLMWKTGHSLIKSKMKETEAELAGEMSATSSSASAGTASTTRLYAAARLLEILAASPDDPETIFATLPKGVSTPELKIEVARATSTASWRSSCRRRSSKARASRPSMACAPTGRTAGAWCVHPTPRLAWCCASTPRIPSHWRACRRPSASSCTRSIRA